MLLTSLCAHHKGGYDNENAEGKNNNFLMFFPARNKLFLASCMSVNSMSSQSITTTDSIANLQAGRRMPVGVTVS